jgi:hypothetical protein
MNVTTYLVFGDLHGRVLPAFRLATVWAREHNRPVAGLLQVGDLGYFPDLSRLDSATRRQAADDPLELGVLDVVAPSKLADEVLLDPDCPPALWFTAGNHEDHDALRECAAAVPRQPDFCVDGYGKVRGVRDGAVADLPGGLRVGVLWGIDDRAPNARRKTPPGGRIQARSATRLCAETFDVLLTHESPRDAVLAGAGSEDITALIRLAQPEFAFFGHYHSDMRRVEGTFGRAQVYLMHGFELRHRGGCAEPGSVGVLTCDEAGGRFEYLDRDWLKTFTRHNWRHR